MLCKHCNRDMLIISRGLCSTCYGDCTIRDKYPRAPKELVEWCLHCNVRRASRPRGLCVACYYNRSVRALYRTFSNSQRGEDEPTEAELDERIAKQRENLPRWWLRGEPTGGTQSGNLE